MYARPVTKYPAPPDISYRADLLGECAGTDLAGEGLEIDVRPTHHQADCLTVETFPQRIHQPRQCGGTSRFDSELCSAEGQSHRLADLLVVDQHDLVDVSENEYGSHRGAPNESAMVRTASIACGEPALKLRFRLSAPSGSTT